jgi:5-methylcytosine-specific restriction endonuclease McrA
MRACSKCGQEKPPEAFGKDKAGPDGLMRRCRQCLAGHDLYRKRDPEKIRESNQRWYANQTPEQKTERQEKHIVTRRAWRKLGGNDLKRKERAYALAWYYANRNYAAEKDREERGLRRDRERRLLDSQGEPRRERAREASRICYARHREDYLRANKKWREAHPEKNAAKAQRRYQRLGTLGRFTAEEWASLKKMYGERCLCCGMSSPHISLSPDHVISVARGGSGDIGNIQPLCRTCNQRKGTRSTDYRPQWAWLFADDSSLAGEI